MARRILSRFQEEEVSPINLTPLIDVVFVILIMFILIAPILEMDQIELASASPSSKNISLLKKEETPIAIRVDQFNKVYINEIQTKPNEWLKAFLALKTKNPEARPRLFHDKRGAFGTYQQLKAALEKAGFHEMDLILGPEENN